MTRLCIRACSLLTGAALASTAAAQTITWGPVLPSVAPTDVSIDGGLVFAGNAHNPNVAPIPATVNGVTFTGGFHPTGWNGYIVGGLNVSTTGNGEFDNLLGSSLAMQTAPESNPSVWGGIRLDNLATLHAGYTYQVQVWFTDQRTGTPTNVLYDRVMTLSSAFGPAALTGGQVTNLGSLQQGPLSGPLEADPDNAPAVNSPDLLFGSHCTGTFVYNPADQLWLLIQGTHPIPTNNLSPHITALQIRDLTSASHQPYGAGCYSYTSPESFMEAFPGTPAAKAELDGNAMQYSLTSNGYVAIWIPGGGALYVPPTASATIVANADDTTTTFAPTVAPPVPGGTAPSWTISSNGVLTAAATGNQGTAFTASLAATAAETGLAWYCWRDYNPGATGSGKVKTEEIGGVLYVTFDGVYEFGSTNPATFQWQINLGTGDVFLVWQSMATSTNTTTMVVGCTLAGAGNTPTSMTLSNPTPFVLAPQMTQLPLALSASPPPVINPSTTVTYTIDNVPEFAPNTGVHLSIVFLSVNPVISGIDLTGILTGLPGCRAYIGSLDLGIGLAITATPTNSVQVTYSGSIFSPGNVIAAQAVGFFNGSFPLLNGENRGFVFSNGVRSITQLQ